MFDSEIHVFFETELRTSIFLSRLIASTIEQREFLISCGSGALFPADCFHENVSPLHHFSIDRNFVPVMSDLLIECSRSILSNEGIFNRARGNFVSFFSPSSHDVRLVDGSSLHFDSAWNKSM